jgi:hypothetical protein
MWQSRIVYRERLGYQAAPRELASSWGEGKPNVPRFLLWLAKARDTDPVG